MGAPMTDFQHDKLLWCDVETTGLYPNATDFQLLELGFVITDKNLNQLDSCQWIFFIDKVLSSWDAPVLEMHYHNNLFFECMMDGEHQNEKAIDGWLMECFPEFTLSDLDTRIPLHGSSVHFDLEVLKTIFPRLESTLHYRVVDISSLKQIAQRYLPNVFETRPKGQKLHRVMPDLEDTLAEARHYLLALGLIQ